MQIGWRHALPLVFVVLLVAGLGAAALGLQPGEYLHVDGLIAGIQDVQRTLHRQLASAMHAVQEEGIAASWTLIGLSFFYGVFHAAGPGHGKVVISTYLLTHESALRRGLVLAALSSLMQGVTAVVAVAATVAVLDLSLRQAQSAAAPLEMVSYGLVMLVGVMLLVGRVRKIARRTAKARAHHAHDNVHDDEHECSDCGHVHGPSREVLEAPLSLKAMAALVLSVGIRPCSGGILVLLVAYSLDLPWAGVAAVLAMSAGTAMTVSAMATLSVYSRKGALWLARMLPDHESRIAVLIDIVALLGGIVILLAGGLMLHAAWSAPVHPFR